MEDLKNTQSNEVKDGKKVRVCQKCGETIDVKRL